MGGSMSKVLIVFGSSSDEPVYGAISKILKDKGIEHDVIVASAHRDPEKVKATVSGDYSVVIAGAGLTNALAGVVASHVISPVIGVPVGANYQGLDSLLSVMQLPPGIPVLGVGVNQSKVAAESAIKLLKQYNQVNLIVDKSTKASKKAKEILSRFKVVFKESTAIDRDMINIAFVYFDEPIEQKDELVIYVPLILDKEKDKAEAALNLLKHTDHGLWVGLNRGENAALAAVEILNLDDGFTKELRKYRNELKKK